MITSERTRWPRTLQLLGAMLGLHCIPFVALAEPAQSTYEDLETAYRVQPTATRAAQWLESGSRSASLSVRLETARNARRWLRHGALVDDPAVRARAAVVVAERDLGQLVFRGSYLDAVQVDGEILEASALHEPWPVLPGSHEVTIGTVAARVSVSSGLLAYVDAPKERPPVSGWRMAKRRWPDAKVATEFTLAVCAATGVFGGVAYGFVRADEPNANGTDGSQRALMLTAVGVGAACLVGAVLVPILWRGAAVPVTRATSRLQVTPVSLQISF